MKPYQKYLPGGGMVLIAAVLLVPLNHKVAAPLRLQILDEAGNPAADIRVEQEWDYSVLDSEPHREVTRTDANGYVEFPQRSVRVSTAWKLLSRAASVIPHQSEVGPNASIWAYGPDAWDVVICSVNNPPPRQLQLRRWGETP